jgi:uncharacterized membrane protein YsdA (DUF1294 family)/cold shock CspA family protein
VDWNDERGFGFITPTAGGARAFVHVSDFPRGQRPVSGCQVSYAELRDDRQRLRASQVRYLSAPPAARASLREAPLALATVGLFFTVLVGLVILGELPVLLLASYVLFSVIAFLLYRADKAAAQQGERRTPESTLHTIALVGGWPGALLARQVFRHKTIKQPFRAIFWVTVVANCLALAWFVSEGPLALP